jgi:hypothetical protein
MVSTLHITVITITILGIITLGIVLGATVHGITIRGDITLIVDGAVITIMVITLAITIILKTKITMRVTGDQETLHLHIVVVA